MNIYSKYKTLISFWEKVVFADSAFFIVKYFQNLSGMPTLVITSAQMFVGLAPASTCTNNEAPKSFFANINTRLALDFETGLGRNRNAKIL
jgi:hypothetical protein